MSEIKIEINYFKANFKYLRRNIGLTQTEIGAHLGIGKSQVSEYENGSSLPLMPMARKMARFFEVSLDELFESDLLNPIDRPPKNGKRMRFEPPDTEGVGKEQIEASAVLIENDVGGSYKNKASPPQGRVEETDDPFTAEDKKKLKKLLELIS
jgi:transcriptional regulator with XRE-family HTH domain